MLIKNFAFLGLVLSFALANDAFARRNQWFNPNAAEQQQQQTKPSTDKLPDCLDRSHQSIQGNNNEQVIRWKTETKNQYLDRALVTGKFVKYLNNKSSHLHFDIELDAKADSRNADLNHLEVVYNREFGDIATIRDGATVVACGDFINSFAQAGRYPPSPVGAIIHWVHQSNNVGKHSNGFVAIDGVVYGDEGDAINGDSRGRGRNGGGQNNWNNRNNNNDDQDDNNVSSIFSGFAALAM